MKDIFKMIEEATEDMGNFSLEWNPQRAYYETVKEYLKNFKMVDDFENEAERERAIQENTLVYVQWYKRTPVSSYIFAAPDLDSLVELLQEELSE